MEKRDRNELLVQKIGRLYNILCSPVSLSVSRDGYLHFGDTVMLVNVGASSANPNTINGVPRHRAALGFHCTADALLSASTFSENTAACAWPGRFAPCNLNCFVLLPSDGSSREGDVLRYGQPFEIASRESSHCGQVFLRSNFANFQQASKKKRHCELNFVRNRSYETQWQVLFFDPQLRMENEGLPVPTNVRVIISHLRTNQNLAVEDVLARTPLGVAYEASVNTYLDSHKSEMDNNQFVIVQVSERIWLATFIRRPCNDLCTVAF